MVARVYWPIALCCRNLALAAQRTREQPGNEAPKSTICRGLLHRCRLARRGTKENPWFQRATDFAQLIVAFSGTNCLTNELGIPISFKHLQRITKDLGVRCKRPKLELLHGEDYEEGKEKVQNYKQIASALKKREL